MQHITKENNMTIELQERIWIQAEPGITIFTNTNYCTIKIFNVLIWSL